MLAHRPRHWPGIEASLVQHLLFAGIIGHTTRVCVPDPPLKNIQTLQDDTLHLALETGWTNVADYWRIIHPTVCSN